MYLLFQMGTWLPLNLIYKEKQDWVQLFRHNKTIFSIIFIIIIIYRVGVKEWINLWQ